MTEARAHAALPVSRRTQRRRSDEMVDRLLDAAIETVGQLGYARSSIQAIADTAGVSKGAVFAHFPAKLDLSQAVITECSRRLVDGFIAHLDAVDGPEPEDVLRALQAMTRTRDGFVWADLQAAARTDPGLRRRFTQVGPEIFASFVAAARHAPVLDRCAPEELVELVVTLLKIFRSSAASLAAIPASAAFDESEIRHAAVLIRAVVG